MMRSLPAMVVANQAQPCASRASSAASEPLRGDGGDVPLERGGESRPARQVVAEHRAEAEEGADSLFGRGVALVGAARPGFEGRIVQRQRRAAVVQPAGADPGGEREDERAGRRTPGQKLAQRRDDPLRYFLRGIAGDLRRLVAERAIAEALDRGGPCRPALPPRGWRASGSRPPNSPR